MAAPRPPPLYITNADVERLVEWVDIVQCVYDALEQCSEGEKGGVVLPVRSDVPVDQEGVLLCMPAYSQKLSSLGVKVITLFPNNDVQGLPTHQGIVLVFDPTTGSLLATVQAEHLTAMRTAAASICAIKVLSRGSLGDVMCVVGTGTEARSHLLAAKALFKFKEIRLWGRSKKNADKCAEDVGGGVRVFESLEEAVNGADVIVTVTMASEPVLFGRWLKTGAIVCCVGACQPTWRELDDELMHNAVVTVDTREGASKESGDIILSKVKIYAEIGEIISGAKPHPILADFNKKLFLFKSQGMALEDAISSKLVYKKFVQDMESKS